MGRLMRSLVGVPAAVVLIGVGTTGVASATDGTPSGAPPEGAIGVWCVSTTGAKACFQAYGDKVWVKDTKANGDSAAGTISDTETSMSWHRECFNTRGADGGWVMCNFDVPENSEGLLWAANKPFVGSQSSTKIWTTIS
ncbi:hypothetical protein ACIA49_18665 [Kribbella sp. NPDC051587]|uniref:hypothetical protein n=1 Tax=Kribbella sp. NPDC051587 TaxID=3364119 RepID=UPI00378C1D1A